MLLLTEFTGFLCQSLRKFLPSSKFHNDLIRSTHVVDGYPILNSLRKNILSQNLSQL